MTELKVWRGTLVVLVLFAATAIATQAQVLTTLLTFDKSNGYKPLAGLVQSAGGSLYGTASSGGDLSCNPPYGCGTVFKITRGGTQEVVHTFKQGEGVFPSGTLAQATDGNFYGVTVDSGAVCCGTVFRMTPAGELTTLLFFGGGNGSYPAGGLIQGNDENFYGTASTGGANGGGTVFKITSAGVLTVLYNFCGQPNCGDGDVPLAGLVRATDGNFYGTTASGGIHGVGTVFRVTPSGAFTTLASIDEGYFANGLVQATDGNLYGTTQLGGGCFPTGGCGTVFRVTLAGSFTTIYSFCVQYFDDCLDCSNPGAALVQANDGSLYGTTISSGSEGGGTIFSITLDGTLTTLYNFCSGGPCPNG